jgi:hypothetical protein
MLVSPVNEWYVISVQWQWQANTRASKISTDEHLAGNDCKLWLSLLARDFHEGWMAAAGRLLLGNGLCIQLVEVLSI